ncbi:MAG: antibiotic biosynthesis monooxygenase [Rhodospirillaceae bacterium]|nr:antibiotic biosynthesis monooxygenase [Rhodospirillaceae bacterium]
MTAKPQRGNALGLANADAIQKELVMSEIHIVVGLHAKPGGADELRRDLAALVEPSRNEPGNIAYDLYEDINSPGHFVFVEHWASSEAQQQHHNHGLHIQYFHANGDRNIEQRDFIRLLKRVPTSSSPKKG